MSFSLRPSASSAVELSWPREKSPDPLINMDESPTQIGRTLIGGRARWSLAIGLSAVAVDMWLVWLQRYPESVEGRWAVALSALAAFAWLSGGDLATIGLATPAGGWLRWIRISILIGLGVGACVGVAAGICIIADQPLPKISSTAPDEIGSELPRMCVFAPLLEEPIYRIALCVPLVAVLGTWPTVVVSGVVFGLLHVLYGNPGPDNAVAGFFLAWAYLRSGSVYVPVLLHSAGNLFVLASQVGFWYWSTAAA